MENKNQIKTNPKILKLIKTADYLTEAQKNDWLKIAENLNEAEQKIVIGDFEKLNLEEKEKKMELVFKAGLGDLYKAKIKEISVKHLAIARKKSEAYTTQTEEKPEDILSKLNDV